VVFSAFVVSNPPFNDEYNVPIVTSWPAPNHRICRNVRQDRTHVRLTLG
jgi:hypothetical protein